MDYPIYKVAVTDSYGLMCVIFHTESAGERVYVEKPGSLAPLKFETNLIEHTNDFWRDPSTYQEWLSFFPDPYRSQALENRAKFTNVESVEGVDSPYRAVDYGFTWRKTPEGHHYWSEIHRQVNKLLRSPIFYTKNSPKFHALIEEISDKKEVKDAEDSEEVEGNENVQYLATSDQSIYTFDEDYLQEEGYVFIEVSRAEFTSMIEAFPDKKIEERFSWKGYSCLITPQKVTVGCQEVSEEDIQKVESLIQLIDGKTERFTIAGGQDIRADIQATVKFSFDGGREAPAEDFKEIVKLIRAAQKKVKEMA